MIFIFIHPELHTHLFKSTTETSSYSEYIYIHIYKFILTTNYDFFKKSS